MSKATGTSQLATRSAMRCDGGLLILSASCSHADELLEGTVLAYLGGGDVYGAEAVNGAAEHVLAHAPCQPAGIRRS